MKKILILIFSIFSLNNLISQNESKRDLNFSFPTNPTVYEYTKYGDISVNEYRGLADISIPLYQIKCGGLNIPLKLDYYSGGIKVAEEAGVVGLGWSLNLPTIIQTVMDEDELDDSVVKYSDLPAYTGNPIFISRGNFHPSVGIISGNYCEYGGQHIVSNIPNYFAINYTNFIKKDGNYICSSDANYAWEIVCGQYHDSEPDIFTVYIEGVELVFSTKIVNDEILFIVINGRNEFKISKENSSIKIVSPKGDSYFFEIYTKIESDSYGTGFFDIIRSYSSGYSSVGTNVQKVFKLTKVITSKNNLVEFEYETNQVNELLKKSYNYYKKLNLTTLTNLSTIAGYYDGFSRLEPSQVGQSSLVSGGIEHFFGLVLMGSTDPDIGNISPQDDFMWTTNYTNQTQNYYFIKKITTEKEEINFSYEDRIDYEGMKKLTNINVKNIKNDLIKNITFNYSYFGNQLDYKNARLKLNSVSIDNDNPYIFQYNTIELPPKDSKMIDFWGFYNGHNNTNLFPNLQELGYNYSDNSQNSFMSNLNFMKAGTIERIIYPMGGYSDFEFELHHFTNFIQFDNTYDNSIYNGNLSDVYGGGLRIKKISSYSSDNEIFKQKIYSYTGGKNIFKKKLAKQYSLSVAQVIDILPCTSNHTTEINTYTATILEAGLSSNYGTSIVNQEDYIGYDSVEIKESSISENGKIVRNFYNFPFNMFIPTQSKNFTPLYFSNGQNVLNGNLLSESFFNESNLLLRTNEFTYTTKSTGESLYGIKISGYDYYLKHFCAVCSENNYGSYCDVNAVPNSILTSYPVKGYSVFRSRVKNIEYFPLGNKETTTYYNYNNNNIPTGKTINDANGNTIYSESTNMMSTTDLINKNILDLPSSTSISENGSVKKYFNYVYQEVNTVTLPSTIEELPGGNPDPSKKINTFYDLYDDKSNLIQFHRENDIYTSVIWGYNKTLIVAKIENAQYSQIQSSLIQAVQSASDTGTEAQLQIALDNLRNSLPGAMVTTYTHKPLVGISCITDSKGDKIMYYYDSNNRLEYVKDKDGNILNEYEYHYRPQN
ncbi:hypothetical protein NHF50_13840 [Flavobacterium sp. NRK F10]|uniref:hypothetical protein n=1 Tax=Flavobacterium sp. NRK F10 TaxID=2954931 RepID=UPI002090595A|nr:hypothetical protein [Flavobacterium sp. NRK F10]MCO6176129.1 hypothetical protein [Flavobacterium sp. NRK F10]